MTTSLWATETADEFNRRQADSFRAEVEAAPPAHVAVLDRARTAGTEIEALARLMQEPPDYLGQSLATLEQTAREYESLASLVGTAPDYTAAARQRLDQFGFPEGAAETTRALGRTTVPVPEVVQVPPAAPEAQVALGMGEPEAEATLGALAQTAARQMPGAVRYGVEPLVRGAALAGPRTVESLAGSARRLPEELPRAGAAVAEALAAANVPAIAGPGIGFEGAPLSQARAERMMRPEAAVDLVQTAGDVANLWPTPVNQLANLGFEGARAALGEAGVSGPIQDLAALGAVVAGPAGLRAGGRLAGRAGGALVRAGEALPEGRLAAALGEGIERPPYLPPGPTDTSLPALLRAAAGAPSRAEVLGGQVGMLGGAVGGALTAEEDVTFGERLTRAGVGAVAGAAAGRGAVRLPGQLREVGRAAGITLGEQAPQMRFRDMVAVFDPASGRIINSVAGEREHWDILTRLRLRGEEPALPVRVSVSRRDKLIDAAADYRGQWGPTQWRGAATRTVDYLRDAVAKTGDDPAAWRINLHSPEGEDWFGVLDEGLEGLRLSGRPQTAGTFGIITGAPRAPATTEGGTVLPRAVREQLDFAAEVREALRARRGGAFQEVGQRLTAAPEETRSLLARADDLTGTYGRLNLLLSPLTHLRNIAGTAPALGWQLAEGLVAPLFEPLARRLGKAGVSEARYAGEAGQMARGYWHALSAAGTNLVDVLRRGDPALTAAQMGRAPAGRLERALDVGFRPLTAADAFFKTIAEGGELYRLAYRSARARGHTGAALAREAQRLVERPTAAMVEAVEQAGRYATYTQEMDRVGKALEWIGHQPGMAVLMPFVRTPYNAAKFDLERSPLGALSVGKAMLDPKATSGEVADRMARTLLGSVVAAGLFKYALDGNVTGAMPDSPSERDAWEQEGKRPFSIRIGNSWWDFRIIPGLNANLAIAAELASAVRGQEAAPDRTWVQRASRFALELADVLVQRPLLDNLAGLMRAIDEPARADSFFERLGATAVGMAIPASSTLRYAENIVDPYLRVPEGVGERVAAGIPGLAGGVPVRRTAFGEELPRTQMGLEAAVVPFRRSVEREGVRRYRGSESVEEDTAITAALTAYKHWRADRRTAPRPSDEQIELARRFEGRENPQYTRLRERERARTRREAVERGRAP